jgi:DNA-binding CsgD family transcriptional regulator
VVRIIDRNDELDVVNGFVRARPTGPQALVLSGEAGIGKSTLWGAGVEAASDEGLHVLLSRPTEPDHGLAFAGLNDLLETVAVEVLSSLSPPRRRAMEGALLLRNDDDVDPRALGVALRDGLDVLSRTLNVVVAIDDVQWFDDGSARALAFALRRLEAPLRLLVTRRSGIETSGSRLAEALPDDAVVELAVGALSPSATQAMIAARLNRTIARPALRRIHELSAGNPFFALEIARALDGPIDPTQPLPMPDSLEALMTKRLESVPMGARAVLGLVAAHGNSSLDLLQAAGVSDDELDLALDTNVLRLDGSMVGFTHPLLASTAYGQLMPGERRRAHRLLGELVIDAIARARHLALGAAGHDLDTAATLDAAAQQAHSRGAVGVAAELRAHALRLTPEHDVASRHLRTIELAHAHLANGNHTGASQLARHLIERTESPEQRARAVLLLCEVEGGRSDLTDMLLETLDGVVGNALLSFHLHLLLGWHFSMSDRTAAAEMHASTALELAEQLDGPALVAEALWTLAAVRATCGAPDTAHVVDRAFEAAARIDDATAIVRVAEHISPAVTTWTGDHERLRQLLEPACAEFADRDELAVEPALWKMIFVELAAGRLRAAEEVARQHDAIVNAYLSDRTGSGGGFPLALTLALRGKFDEARRLADAALCADGSLPLWAEAQMRGILGRVELWTGSPATACDHFAVAEQRLPSAEPALRHWRADYVEALLAVERSGQAVGLLNSWDRDARQLGRTTVLADVWRCRGLVAASQGNVSDAEALLEQAVARSAVVGNPVGRARALLALGRVRRRAKKKRGSRDAIQSAVELFHECGADEFARAARAELGSISGRRRHEGLSPAERRIAALAADGRTNREIATELCLAISTVETHLSHVYAKLGVRSRTELARRPESH